MTGRPRSSLDWNTLSAGRIIFVADRSVDHLYAKRTLGRFDQNEWEATGRHYFIVLELVRLVSAHDRRTYVVLRYRSRLMELPYSQNLVNRLLSVNILMCAMATSVLTYQFQFGSE